MLICTQMQSCVQILTCGKLNQKNIKHNTPYNSIGNERFGISNALVYMILLKSNMNITQNKQDMFFFFATLLQLMHALVAFGFICDRVVNKTI